MRRLSIVFAILLIFVLAALAQADSGIIATMQIDRSNITVGDVVPVVVTVTHPKGWRVVVPTLDKTWGDLTVRDQQAPKIATNADGTETTTATIDVAHYAPGTITTPILTVAVADDQGQVHPVPVQPVTYEVKSVLAPNDDQLRDIKPQVELWQWNSSPVPFVASVLLALTVLGGASIWTWQHRPLQDKRTPRQRALDELQAIDAAKLVEQGDFKTYGVRVSETLRTYLDKGCKIPAMDLATGELAQTLKAQGVPTTIAAQIIQVLRSCDAVKFGDDASDPNGLKMLTSIAQQIVLIYPPALPAPVKKNRFALG